MAHLILYHLSICCKKKYFDFEREILPFASENWDSLLLGEVRGWGGGGAGCGGGEGLVKGQRHLFREQRGGGRGDPQPPETADLPACLPARQ